MPETVLDVATANVGFIATAKVLHYIAAWDQARHLAGDQWPADDDRGALSHRVIWFARASAIKERQAWGRLSKFRQAFPLESDPTRLLELGQAAVDSGELDQIKFAKVVYVPPPVAPPG